ncbi:MFS transporter [Streptomyces genisteinicus]|uniref:MFS transporter n=1 Tax=Streptomyces genisteinicus TaxID=2768068 RepID=A0A7H0HXA2_9ACTN|nr:MFS transporter [Streptomyces genisteinicus]QNP65168.1 MFS transporter [Streptomyces genisteinicus]
MVPSTRRRWLLLTVVSAGLLLITLDNSILYAALPTLIEDLGASGSQSLWIINAYPVVMAGLLLGSGTLGDRVGHRRMFLIGLVVFGAASLAAAFSSSPEALIAARAFLAVGAAAMMPATLALIRVTFDDERERNLAIAVWGSLAIVGSGLGPIVGGILLDHFWWGSVFLINVPVVVVALTAALVLAPPDDADPSKRWDLISSLLALVALVSLVIAIKEATKSSPAPLVVAAAVLAASVGGWAFARRQRRLPYPLLDFAIFRNPAFLAGVLAAGLSMFAIAGVQLVTTQRFQLVEGLTPLRAGLLVAAVALGALPTAMVGGAVLHKVGLLPIVAGGLALSTAGTLLVLIGFDTSMPLLVTGLLVTGAGLGAAMSVASSAIMGNVPARRAGMASSVEEVSYEFGSLVAVALLGSLLTAVYSTTVDLPAGVPDRARDSLDAALALGQGDPALIRAASDAFDHAYAVVMVVVTAVMALGAIVTGLLLRRHGPGSALTAAAPHAETPAHH